MYEDLRSYAFDKRIPQATIIRDALRNYLGVASYTGREVKNIASNESEEPPE